MEMGNEAILESILMENLDQICDNMFNKFSLVIHSLKSEVNFKEKAVREIIGEAVRLYPTCRIATAHDFIPRVYNEANVKWRFGDASNLAEYSATLTCIGTTYCLNIYIPTSFIRRKDIIFGRIQGQIATRDLEMSNLSEKDQLALATAACTSLTYGIIDVKLILDENDTDFASPSPVPEKEEVHVYTGEHLVAKYWRISDKECKLLFHVPCLDVNPPMTKRLLKEYNIDGDTAKIICRGIVPNRIEGRSLNLPSASNSFFEYVQELCSRKIASQSNIASRDGGIDKTGKSVMAYFDKDRQELLVYIPKPESPETAAVGK